MAGHITYLAQFRLIGSHDTSTYSETVRSEATPDEITAAYAVLGKEMVKLWGYRINHRAPGGYTLHGLGCTNPECGGCS